MSSYRALLAQRAKLEADIAAARAAERRGALQLLPIHDHRNIPVNAKGAAAQCEMGGCPYAQGGAK